MMILPRSLAPPEQFAEALRALGEGDPVFPLGGGGRGNRKDDGNGAVLVTIDPLDATKEFTEELLHFVTTQQCVVVGGRPILGILLQPFIKKKAPTVAVAPAATASSSSSSSSSSRVFGGVPSAVNKAAAKDASSSSSSSSSSFSAAEAEEDEAASGAHGSVVTLSRSHAGEGEELVREYLPGHTALPAGGAGYKALLVAAGRAGAYLVSRSTIRRRGYLNKPLGYTLEHADEWIVLSYEANGSSFYQA